MAINVTANWHLIRAMDPLLRRSDAGRAVFVTREPPPMCAPMGPYSVSKAALNALAGRYAAETSSTPLRVNLFNPGPTRTRMRALVMPGEGPDDAPDAGRGGRKTPRSVPAGLRRNRQSSTIFTPKSFWNLFHRPESSRGAPGYARQPRPANKADSRNVGAGQLPIPSGGRSRRRKSA